MKSNGYKPDELCLNNMLMTAIIKYEDDKTKLDKFAKWIAKQTIKYNIKISQAFKKRLFNSVAFHDDSVNKIAKFRTYYN